MLGVPFGPGHRSGDPRAVPSPGHRSGAHGGGALQPRAPLRGTPGRCPAPGTALEHMRGVHMTFVLVKTVSVLVQYLPSIGARNARGRSAAWPALRKSSYCLESPMARPALALLLTGAKADAWSVAPLMRASVHFCAATRTEARRQVRAGVSSCARPVTHEDTPNFTWYDTFMDISLQQSSMNEREFYFPCLIKAALDRETAATQRWPDWSSLSSGGTAFSLSLLRFEYK